MTRLTVIAAGTRGDTQPYIALAVGLKRAGFDVRVATNRTFESLVRDNDLEFFPLHVDFFDLVGSDQFQEFMQSDNPLKFAINSFRLMGQTLESLQKESWDACEGSGGVIYHPLMSPNSYFIARHLNIPCFVGGLYPMHATRAFPALPFFNMPKLGGAFNLFTHAFTDQVIWQLFRAPVDKFWRKKFGKSLAPFFAPNKKQNAEHLPVLYGYSNHIFPRPVEWGSHIHITGYWFLDPPQSWQPPSALIEFLNAGERPVYVGFGSMGDRKSARDTTQLIINALAQAKQRGVILGGWSGLGKEIAMPDHIFAIESIPHSWLFPQMNVIVHHGGAGTTAAAFRAGVPAVVVPHTGDQPIWGALTHQLGVGTRPILRRHLTAENLAGAIGEAVTDRQMQSHAAALGEKIRAEDGIMNAAKIVKEHFQ